MLEELVMSPIHTTKNHLLIGVSGWLVKPLVCIKYEKRLKRKKCIYHEK